jgi:hypothetical protein
VGVARVACVWERSPAPVHSEARSQALLRGLVRSTSGHCVASKTHDSVALIVNSMIAGQAYTAHLVSKPRSHLPRTVGSDFPEGEGGVGVW